MEWTEYAETISEKCRLLGIPSSATFEITPYCNFNCNMCYVHLTREQAESQGQLLSMEQWVKIAEETKRLGTLGVEITGGEPLTRPGFSNLYVSLIKLGFLVSLRTNGYLINNDAIKLLRYYRPRGINITIYGASNETYERVCGISDGFSVVSKHILSLRNEGIVPKLTMTLTKDNVGDRARINEWATQNGFNITLYGGLVTPIRSAKRSINHLKVEYGFEHLDPNMVFPNRDVQNREKYMHPFWMCREFGTRYCITWDGRMTFCNLLPSIWTDPLSEGVGKAFKSLNEKLNSTKRPTECYSCDYIDYCGACPARFLSETGNHETTCTSICDKAKVRYVKSINAKHLPAELEQELEYLGTDERNGFNED